MKPGNFPHHCLIGTALATAHKGQLDVKEIYTLLQSLFPYVMQQAPNSWKNSVRHCLSCSGYFEKVDTFSDPLLVAKKGNKWRIRPCKALELLQSMEKYNSKIATIMYYHTQKPDLGGAQTNTLETLSVLKAPTSNSTTLSKNRRPNKYQMPLITVLNTQNNCMPSRPTRQQRTTPVTVLYTRETLTFQPATLPDGVVVASPHLVDRSSVTLSPLTAPLQTKDTSQAHSTVTTTMRDDQADVNQAHSTATATVKDNSEQDSFRGQTGNLDHRMQELTSEAANEETLVDEDLMQKNAVKDKMSPTDTEDGYLHDKTVMGDDQVSKKVAEDIPTLVAEEEASVDVRMELSGSDAALCALRNLQLEENDMFEVTDTSLQGPHGSKLTVQCIPSIANDTESPSLTQDHSQVDQMTCGYHDNMPSLVNNAVDVSLRGLLNAAMTTGTNEGSSCQQSLLTHPVDQLTTYDELSPIDRLSTYDDCLSPELDQLMYSQTDVAFSGEGKLSRNLPCWPSNMATVHGLESRKRPYCASLEHQYCKKMKASPCMQ